MPGPTCTASAARCTSCSAVSRRLGHRATNRSPKRCWLRFTIRRRRCGTRGRMFRPEWRGSSSVCWPRPRTIAPRLAGDVAETLQPLAQGGDLPRLVRPANRRPGLPLVRRHAGPDRRIPLLCRGGNRPPAESLGETDGAEGSGTPASRPWRSPCCWPPWASWRPADHHHHPQPRTENGGLRLGGRRYRDPCTTRWATWGRGDAPACPTGRRARCRRRPSLRSVRFKLKTLSAAGLNS